jgi:flagellar basal body-associated protein FliL
MQGYAMALLALTFLALTILIIIVVIVIVAIILAVSFAIGVATYSAPNTDQTQPMNTDPCAQCNADKSWYLSLPDWRQNATVAWWWANRAACAIKGCK